MVPVRQTDGDHKVGMYDVKNKHFYGSKSSYEFVAGPTSEYSSIVDSNYIFTENTDESVVAVWKELSELYEKNFIKCKKKDKIYKKYNYLVENK